MLRTIIVSFAIFSPEIKDTTRSFEIERFTRFEDCTIVCEITFTNYFTKFIVIIIYIGRMDLEKVTTT